MRLYRRGGICLFLPKAPQWPPPQVAVLIARYLVGGGQMDKATLDTLAAFRPTYLCLLSPEQLDSMPHNVVW